MPLSLFEHIAPDLIVGIWHITESEEELIDTQLISKSAIKASQRYGSAARRREWLASRCLIAEMTNASSEITYIGKKPVLRNAHWNHISISHTDKFVVICCAENDVGIDIEATDRDVTRISKKFLGENDIACKNSAFNLLKIWTAKEATYKMVYPPSVAFRDIEIIKMADTHAVILSKGRKISAEFSIFRSELLICRVEYL